jgi:hypothetical protein
MTSAFKKFIKKKTDLIESNTKEEEIKCGTGIEENPEEEQKQKEYIFKDYYTPIKQPKQQKRRYMNRSCYSLRAYDKAFASNKGLPFLGHAPPVQEVSEEFSNVSIDDSIRKVANGILGSLLDSREEPH